MLITGVQARGGKKMQSPEDDVELSIDHFFDLFLN
jgi:hypothetical protein